MMAGIESELRAAGKHVIITTGHSEEEKEKLELSWCVFHEQQQVGRFQHTYRHMIVHKIIHLAKQAEPV